MNSDDKILVQLNEIHRKLDEMRPHIDGVPLIWKAVQYIRQDMRMLSGQFKDFASLQFTSGQAHALHEAINDVHANHDALSVRIATIERQIKELQERTS